MKIIRPVEKLICSLIFLVIFGCSQSHISKVGDLKCENLENPPEEVFQQCPQLRKVFSVEKKDDSDTFVQR